jgi:hypothetical protein
MFFGPVLSYLAVISARLSLLTAGRLAVSWTRLARWRSISVRMTSRFSESIRFGALAVQKYKIL